MPYVKAPLLSSEFTMNTYRAYLNGKRVGTYVELKDKKFLQVYPAGPMKITFKNAQELATTVCHERFDPPLPVAPAPAPLATVDNFTCPACRLQSGADHRMCIVNHYNCSVKDWEIACRLRPAAPTPAPAPKVADNSGHEAARTAFGLSDYSRLTNMGCSDVKRLSAITDPELMDAAELLTKLIRAGKVKLMDKESGAAFTASGVVGFGGNKLLIFNER